MTQLMNIGNWRKSEIKEIKNPSPRLAGLVFGLVTCMRLIVVKKLMTLDNGLVNGLNGPS